MLTNNSLTSRGQLALTVYYGGGVGPGFGGGAYGGLPGEGFTLGEVHPGRSAGQIAFGSWAGARNRPGPGLASSATHSRETQGSINTSVRGKAGVGMGGGAAIGAYAIVIGRISVTPCRKSEREVIHPPAQTSHFRRSLSRHVFQRP